MSESVREVIDKFVVELEEAGQLGEELLDGENSANKSMLEPLISAEEAMMELAVNSELDAVLARLEHLESSPTTPPNNLEENLSDVLVRELLILKKMFPPVSPARESEPCKLPSLHADWTDRMRAEIDADLTRVDSKYLQLLAELSSLSASRVAERGKVDSVVTQTVLPLLLASNPALLDDVVSVVSVYCAEHCGGNRGVELLLQSEARRWR